MTNVDAADAQNLARPTLTIWPWVCVTWHAQHQLFSRCCNIAPLVSNNMAPRHDDTAQTRNRRL
jgi:hypothetical protein